MVAVVIAAAILLTVPLVWLLLEVRRLRADLQVAPPRALRPRVPRARRGKAHRL